MVSITEAILIVVLLSSQYSAKGVKAQRDPFEGAAKPNNYAEESKKNCDQVALNPFFEPEMVVGKPWRVYYMWHMNLENRCIDIQFQMATPKIIRRLYYDMTEYLETQPAWGAASLLLSMGRARREMLLFNDQGPAGRFLGVPNTARDGSVLPTKNGVPLMQFQMKLLNEGRYLFLVDCIVGLASLAARLDEDFTRDEILEAAQPISLIYGKGYPACIADITKNEQLVMI